MLSFEKRRWIINQLNKGASVTYIAKAQSISRQAVYDIKQAYEVKGLSALKDKEVGRPEEHLPLDIKQRVIQLRKEGHGIRRIEGLLKLECINVAHNKIHKVLTKLGMVTPEPKKGRRKN